MRRGRIRSCVASACAWLTSAWPALLVLGTSAVLLGGTTPATGPGAAVLALGSVGSAALIVAACGALCALALQALATRSPATAVPGSAGSARAGTIARAEDPGRPGRPRPRAPGLSRPRAR